MYFCNVSLRYDQVINERDILGTQLIRRNDELALLCGPHLRFRHSLYVTLSYIRYEKIKIQQSTLSKGEIQYRDRVEDIRLLKLKINDLKRALQILKRQTSNIDVLRNEVCCAASEALPVETFCDTLGRCISCSGRC